MKKLLFFFFLTPLFAAAQDKDLVVEGVSPNLYINHKVEAKENYYSIGRLYNIGPKEIPPYNNLKLETGLNLGQTLKIPLTSSNFSQSGNAETDETFVPVYYAVKEKEGLYRVALNHNDLPLETLKKWNNIKGDAVKNGTKLIVGYLKVKTELSALAKNVIGASIDANAVVKADEKKDVEDKSNKTVTAKQAGPPVINKETLPPVVIKPETEKKEVVKTVKEPVVTETKTPAVSGKAFAGGEFEASYMQQVTTALMQEAAGTSGIFKSTSGWTDKKYYCLHNSAAPGTIMKITNPANGKFVFAKVLDIMPDIRQNDGLALLISNAAAEELGAAEGNFNCTINYSK